MQVEQEGKLLRVLFLQTSGRDGFGQGFDPRVRQGWWWYWSHGFCLLGCCDDGH